MNNNAPVRATGGGRKRKQTGSRKSSLTRISPPVELIDDNATAAWKTQSKVLIERGMFEVEDAPLLVAYCNAFAYMIQADEEIGAQGLVVPTSDGSIKKSPYVNVRNDAVAQLTRTGSLLGLDPLSRDRLLGGSSQEAESEANEFDGF